ncbi:MAG: transcription antitermination factor NusB [Rhodospirillales bacterium]
MPRDAASDAPRDSGGDRGPAPGSVARRIAFDVLDAVLVRRQPLAEAFDKHPALAGLAGRDRGFARHLTATALRRLGQIDRLIDLCLARPLPKDAQRVRHILRLGICQLVFLATPAHAAVASAVDLARQRRSAGHAALVNAVLRRLAREASAMIAGDDAARLNTPAWLWDSWTEAYGADVARAIGEAHLSEAPLDLTLNPARTPARREAAAAALAAHCGARRLCGDTLRIAGHAAVTELPGYADGAWWVQDAAAALPVRLLGRIAGKRVIDLCAAPGGKTAQLAAAGAEVIAVDISPARLDRLGENLRRLHLQAALVAADARRWRPDAPADAVLVDVPCSSTGTIRRHPDVARLKSPQDVAALVRLQGELAAHAASLLRPGGTLVYCACSLQPEEGPGAVQALLRSGMPLARRPVDPAEIGGLDELVDSAGDLRTLPCHLKGEGGLDGFYAARLVLHR